MEPSSGYTNYPFDEQLLTRWKSNSSVSFTEGMLLTVTG